MESMTLGSANESPEPTGAALSVFDAKASFVACWLCRSAVSGAIGSAPRSAEWDSIDRSVPPG